MNNLNSDLARMMVAERQRDFEAQRRRHQARPTRPAAKRPEPVGHRQPGLLARLVPWFGARVNTAV
jgi:hypothetical protein